jgi:hypothetical protein
MDARRLAAASRVWERRFTRVVEERRSANVTMRLAEARPGGGEHFCWIRLCHHPGTSGSDLDFEMQVLRAVQGEPGLGVVRPLAGWGGRLPWEGAMRHACLFEAVPGREMLHCPGDVRRFGWALVGLHAALQTVRGVAARRVEAGAACEAAAFWPRRAGTEVIAAEMERVRPNSDRGNGELTIRFNTRILRYSFTKNNQIEQ